LLQNRKGYGLRLLESQVLHHDVSKSLLSIFYGSTANMAVMHILAKYLNNEIKSSGVILCE
jgi:hypothetical protein